MTGPVFRQRYDIDRGGTIDPWEFAGLAEEVEQNYKRRSILTGAAALVGGLIVAKYATGGLACGHPVAHMLAAHVILM